MSSSGTNAIIDSGFPSASLIPRYETGVVNFLQKYPEFNGKDVTIAIFDSGVDPKGSGLEAICDGSVKVIERYDCSGCGDTDTSKVAKVTENGTITGISGKSLKLTPEMISSNPSGEYRIGLKSIHDLFPSKVRDTFINLTKDKHWNEPHKKALAEVARQMANFERNNTDSSNFTIKQKQEKEDLEALQEFLNNYEKKYASIKTSFDCVLYKTCEGWQSVIDTTENGDLENAVHIGEYSRTHEVKNINDNFSVSVNVHDEGNVLELVGMCSSHGTHVASIASANNSCKEGNEVDGVAPNARIVSLTIGEGRLGSMETGTALVRAIIKVMELCNAGTKIDVINMSYGEHAHWANDGRIGSLMAEVVNKYGVVWVASAGNHGPALCTIGTPPDLKELCCVGVGAYVSPQMMEGEYSMREKLPANVYTWTSRDPCIDGGRAVTVCAPGAAITSVPEFTMSKSMLMNGTSMAAPHVAGAIALLISGLKEKGVKYSPYSIKRAISETATKLDYVDQFAQGNGLLNVEKAFDHLVKYANEQENMIRFRVDCGKGKKGIHIRSGQLKKPHDYTVQIEPLFFNQDKTDPKDKINFNLRLVLVSSQPWVKVGSYLDLCYTPRSISVSVDPTALPVGVHTAGIKAYDSSCVEKGVVFEIPVTVVQPHVVNTEVTKTFQPDSPKEFKPNTIQRDFILVPQHATWAVLRMKSVKDVENQRGKFYVHTMQLIPDWYCKFMETQKLFDVKYGGNEVIHAFKCEENNILELCISKYWSNYGTTQLQYSLEFYGIKPTGSSEYTMMHLNGVHVLDIISLGAVDVHPIISLKQAVVPLRPTEAKITPLSPFRDVLPDGRQIYQNCLVYNLHLTKSAEVSIGASVLSHVLYESQFESQLWMLFDSNKMLVACGDAYSLGSSTIKLEKGDYTIRLQVRHERKELLEKVNDTALLIQHKLSSNLALDVYDHYNQAVIGGKKSTTVHLNGATKPKCFYVAALANEKINKANLPAGCTYLNGAIQLAKEELGRVASSRRFKYVIGEQLEQTNKQSGSAAATASDAGSNAANASAGGKSDNKTTSDGSPNKGGKNNKSKGNSYDDYLEGIRDYKCSMISKLGDLSKAEEIYNEVVSEYPKHLSVHMNLIQNLESTVPIKTVYPFSFDNLVRSQSSATASEAVKKVDLEKLSTVLKRTIELTDIVIKETDKDALLAFYGMKTDTRSDASKIKSTMDKQKNTLLEAYAKNGIAKCKLAILEQGHSDEVKTTLSSNLIEQIDSNLVEIQKFVDINDSKVLQFSIWHAFSNRQFGRLAKFLLKLYDEKLSKDVLEELSLIAKEKEWKHLSEQIERQIVSANPGGFRPF